jgi:hypothetical protein
VSDFLIDLIKVIFSVERLSHKQDLISIPSRTAFIITGIITGGNIILVYTMYMS